MNNKKGINYVRYISVVFCGLVGLWGVISPDSMSNIVQTMTQFALTNLDWFFLGLCTMMVILCGYMAFSHYGKIKLGKDNDKPEFSLVSWIAMLFAAGMGAGLLFWGVAEPITHFISPPGMEGGTPQAARQAMIITNLHWGVHAWSTYCISALVIAYFGFRKGLPTLLSTPIRYAFRPRWGNIDLICKITDIIAILAVIFGIAGSLAMGIMQVSSGLNSVMGIFPSNTVSAVILLVLFAFYIVAACSGIDKGIKILSNFNIGLALAILLFILFLGPTKFILEIFLTTLGDYFTSLPSMSFRLFPYQDLSNWSATWTLTYLIWWVAWGPFVGIFIARISRGRTIRQFVLGVIMFPTIFSLLWFSIFGGTAINIELFNGGGLADLIRENVSTALFAFFEYVPFSNTLSILALVLIFIFLVTSADSATFVAGMITSNGALNPSVQCKLVWGIIIAVLTAAALFSGGVAVAKAIAIIGAIPFTIVLSLQIVAFLLVVKTEKP